jgi:hypothetical protein
MQAWLKAANPNAQINSEAEAQRAARASAISIFIGVITGAIGAVWSFMHADELTASVAATADASQAEAMQAGAQAGLWLGVGLVVVQLIFAVVQWRDPKKFIAILFMVLIVLGLLSLLAAPMMASLAPGAPVTPMWQMVLSGVIMIVQLVLHAAGLRGIGKLDQIQMAAAR